MCGRYTFNQQASVLAKHYNLATVPGGLKPNYNVAPGQLMPVIIGNEAGAPTLEVMKWGLVPFWAKDPKIGYKMINARAESIFEKPAWRSLILKKRCLVPADGFYEWKKLASGTKSVKQPFYIHPKQTTLFSFAGIWEVWKDAEGMQWKTYSIITTEPNQEMSNIHDRMPVILHPEDESAWLEPAVRKREDLEPYLHPYEDQGLLMYKVSRDVNSSKMNDEHLLAPV